MKDDVAYLNHILESIAKIERFLKNKNLSEDHEMIDDAIIRNLQIMAESTQKLSEKIKNFPSMKYRGAKSLISETN